jgi:transposase
MKSTYYYNEFFEKGQQVINFNLLEHQLPKNDPVYKLKEVMEELDFSRLLSKYSTKGRMAYNPIMMFSLIVYGNMRNLRSADSIVDASWRDLGFIWLAQGEKPKRDAFYNFINNKLSTEIMDDLHYQFMKLLKEKGLITLETLYVDGTKIEANANRYTFVWRGTINYHLVNLLDHIQSLYEQYNEIITNNGYDEKYGILKEEMFIVEGTEKVKEVILENKDRKRLNKKKLPHKVHFKIDNIGPQSIMKIKQILKKLSEQEEIKFTSSKGQKKHGIQKLYDDFSRYGSRLIKYKENFEIMGEDRNSYSKTDKDSTFMRMKDDHMMNGQLKPGYNLQYGVENHIVTDVWISNDRTDYDTLIPVISKHDLMTGVNLKEIIADSGYCSERNLKFCRLNNIEAYIKLQEHEKMKTRKYHQDIGKHYNMEEIENLDDMGRKYYEYKCKFNRTLSFTHKSTSNQKGFTQEFEHYECESCEGCPLKKECFYNYNEEKYKDQNKKLVINRNWEDLKQASNANIQSDKGIIHRQTRSIQCEGSFGDMKQNDDFNRFNYRTEEKVYKETMLYVFGRNINKYHSFETGKLKKYEGKVA